MKDVLLGIVPQHSPLPSPTRREKQLRKCTCIFHAVSDRPKALNGSKFTSLSLPVMERQKNKVNNVPIKKEITHIKTFFCTENYSNAFLKKVTIK